MKVREILTDELNGFGNALRVRATGFCTADSSIAEKLSESVLIR